MYRRFFTVLLILLTCGFFIFRHIERQYAPVTFVDTVAVANFPEETFIKDEFLLLMDQGDETRLSEVLTEFDLEIISPLGEWVHVKRTSADGIKRVMSLRSPHANRELAMIDALEHHDAVHSASLNYRLPRQWLSSCTPIMVNDQESKETLPQDPLFRHQWYLTKDRGVDVIGAWNITTGNKKTVIALVDRHFDMAESDLSPDRCGSRRYYYKNVLDFMPTKAESTEELSEHGSQVLSVIAPCTDNAVGLAGIDWHAQVFMVDSLTDSSLSARMLGLLWAAGIDICSASIASCPEHVRFQRNHHAANVINTSFGFAGPALTDPPYGPVLDVISRINRQGRIVVASAGNEGGLADRRLPGASGGVISVGSSNKLRQSSWFSNYGKSIDVLAPGEEIIGIKNNRPISLNGTSFSSPLVAGVASLMLAVNPLLSWKHVEFFLKSTADPISCDAYCPVTMNPKELAHCRSYCCEGTKAVCASGIINAQKAVELSQYGFPKRVLVDVDDYYIALSNDNNLTSKIVIKNWGARRGVVRLRRTDQKLSMTPALLSIAPIDQNGIPGLSVAHIRYESMPDGPVVLSLILEAADADVPAKFHDQIEAIVEIVPDDPKIKKRKLNELVHTN